MPEGTLCCRARGGYCDRCDLLVGLGGLHVIGVDRDDGRVDCDGGVRHGRGRLPHVRGAGPRSRPGRRAPGRCAGQRRPHGRRRPVRSPRSPVRGTRRCQLRHAQKPDRVEAAPASLPHYGEAQIPNTQRREAGTALLVVRPVYGGCHGGSGGHYAGRGPLLRMSELWGIPPDEQAGSAPSTSPNRVGGHRHGRLGVSRSVLSQRARSHADPAQSSNGRLRICG